MGKDLKIDKKKYEALIESKAKSATEIAEEIKTKKIKESDWLFKLEDVINICEDVAIGFWHNCRSTANPKSRWNKEHGRKQVTKIVTNAFTSKT